MKASLLLFANKQGVLSHKFCLSNQIPKRQTIFMAPLQMSSTTIRVCPAPLSLDLVCKTRLLGTTEQQERKKTTEFQVDLHLQYSASAMHTSSHVINTNVTMALNAHSIASSLKPYTLNLTQ